MRSRLVLVLSIVLVLGRCSQARGEILVPQKLPDARVVDEGHVLTPLDVMDLEKRSAAIERELRARVLVVTLATLDHEPPERFAKRASQQWKPGARSVLVLLVGGQEAFIEPSDELSRALDAAFWRDVAFQRVEPRLRIEDRRGALVAALDAIAQGIREKAPAKEARPLDLERSLPLEPLAPIASASQGAPFADPAPAIVAIVPILAGAAVFGTLFAIWWRRSGK